MFGRVHRLERPEIESFIRRGFERAYRAKITQFMPILLSLRRESRLIAACGLRPAAATTLFLETYLERPVEDALSAVAGRPVPREGIAEVGNLVVAGPGHARRLIIHLTRHLHPGGAEWVVFTAVPALRNSFTRLGIPLLTLAPAEGRRLGAAAAADWGNYYDQQPLVTAVHVAASFEALRGASCTQ